MIRCQVTIALAFGSTHPSIATVAPKLSLELHRAASEGNTAELNGLLQRYFLSAVCLALTAKGM